MKYSLVLVLSIIIWVLLLYIIYDSYRDASSGAHIAGTASTVNGNEKQNTLVNEKVPSNHAMKSTTKVNEGKPVSSKVLNDKSVKQLAESAAATVAKVDSTNEKVKDKPISNKPPVIPVKTTNSYRVSTKNGNGITWDSFLKLKREVPTSVLEIKTPPSLYLNVCSKDIVGNLTEPALSTANYEWCKWTLSGTGGGVKVCLRLPH